MILYFAYSVMTINEVNSMFFLQYAKHINSFTQ